MKALTTIGVNSDWELSIGWAATNKSTPERGWQYQHTTSELSPIMDDVVDNDPAMRRQTIVERLRDVLIKVAVDQDIKPLPPLFLDPLPDDILIDELLIEHQREAYGDSLKLLEPYLLSKAGEDLQYRWTWIPEVYRPRGDFTAILGKLDDPRNRLQERLQINFAMREQRGHIVAYGAPGTGRSNFLITMLIGLVQRYPPWLFHSHIIDYGHWIAKGRKRAVACYRKGL